MATSAHNGATDHVGAPYIDHPAAVAELLRSGGHTDEVVAIGWLHDVVEDTEVTLDDLRRQGFPESVVQGVDAVTHRRGERREEYIARVIAHPLGRHVKLADLENNTDPVRAAALDPATRERLARKYARDRAQIATIHQAEQGLSPVGSTRVAGGS